MLFGIQAYAQLKFESDNSLHIYRTTPPVGSAGNIQIHSSQDLRFGDGPDGNYNIEYWDGGLNFFKEYPDPDFGDYKLFIRDNGNVGIGKKPGYKLDVNGDIATYGTIRITSDIRKKTSVQPLRNTIGQVRQLNAISFQPIINDTIWYKDSAENKKFTLSKQAKIQQESKRFGFSAQEIQKIFPELVSTDPAGYLNVDYIGLIPVIVEALKEQQTQIEEQKELINYLIKQLKNNSTEKEIIFSIEKAEDSADEIPLLMQNSPNPFNTQTEIDFYIPENIQNANLYVYDMMGVQKMSINIKERNKNYITIQASALKAGTYFYTLICDGKPVDTKQMILTK